VSLVHNKFVEKCGNVVDDDEGLILCWDWSLKHSRQIHKVPLVRCFQSKMGVLVNIVVDGSDIEIIIYLLDGMG
jgi:hypothetical protein